MAKPNPYLILFGVIFLLLGGYLAYLTGVEGGILEYTSAARTGHDQTKVLLLFLSRALMLPCIGIFLIVWGARLKRLMTAILIVLLISVVLNGISIYML